MSSINIPRESIRSKYTKGEKCLFIHIVISFALIVLMCIIYCIHLSLVFHTKEDMFKTSRRVHIQIQRQGQVREAKYKYIGLVYINTTKQQIICNALLLHERWSLTPAQCATIRTEPTIAEYLHLWKIKYQNDNQHINADIKRSLAHSGFNRGNYDNNIGLFEHAKPIVSTNYVVPNNLLFDDKILQKYSNDMFILDWHEDFLKKGHTSDAIVYPVTLLSSSICSTYATVVVESMRANEFCVNFTNNTLRKTLDHGAMLAMNSQIIGFFSWGDIDGKGVPLFILNFLHYKQWFENIIL